MGTFPQAAHRLELRLSGGFELRSGGEVRSLPAPAERLVAFLAVHREPLGREYVAGTLWPAKEEGRALANLRSALWRARRCEPDLVASHRHRRLSLCDRVAIDVRRLGAFRVRDSAAADRTPVEITGSGELLPDWYEDWVMVERERLRQVRMNALEVLCERLRSEGEFGLAIQAGWAAVAGEPLRESARRALMRVYLAQGNLSEVLREYAEYSQLLRRELGVAPSPQMRQLVDEVESLNALSSISAPLTPPRWLGDGAVTRLPQTMSR